MARTLPEWVGATDDTAVPARVRQRVFDKWLGCCHECSGDIQTGRKWQCDHIVPLIQGGTNREFNLAPICDHCHKIKSAREGTEKAKVAAIRQRHIGITQPAGTIRSKGFPESPKKEKAPQRASLPPRSLYARRDT
jgi:hypothetical protein